MTREEAKQELLNREPDFLDLAKKKVNGHVTYVCPICQNGSGKDGTGISLDTSSHSPYKQWKCFKCDFHGDVLELWKAHRGISDYGEAFRTVYEYYGIVINQEQGYHQASYHQERQESKQDLTDFFLQANQHITDTNYHRGLSLETLNRFCIGFVPYWKHPKVSTNVPTTPRLIIPTSRYSYLARDVRAEIPEQQKRFSKSKVGTVHIFNLEALQQANQPIFVVEGEIDALSVLEVGGEAIGLGSTSNCELLAKLLKQQKNRPQFPLILSLDSDESGQEAENKLAKKLDELGISYYRLNIATVATLNDRTYKDANERLLAEREQFADIITEIASSPSEAYQLAKEQEYRDTVSACGRLTQMWKNIHSSVYQMIPTGFPILDSVLDGGLMDGLYVIGAISSLGKTTFALQICDQLASMGRDVLIFSLEMSAEELIAKSISRLTYQQVKKLKQDTCYAKTYLGITQGSRYTYYSSFERDLIQQASAEYANYADRIFIHEGIGNIGVDQIRKQIQEHIKLTGKKPVVLVDYLQILAPVDVRATDKQNTDKAIVELKRISRDFKISVIGISSFNRESYNNAVSMASFKESGAIEYTSDVLIGLQLHGVGRTNFDVTEAKSKSPREIDLVILKNRKGITGRKILYRYECMFNHFVEVSLVQNPTEQDSKSNKGKRSRREDTSY